MAAVSPPPPPLIPNEELASASPPPAYDPRIWWGLAALMGGFFVFGLIWVLFAENIPWADADFYFRGAKSIADGDGYSHPFRAGHPPTAFHPVGYPWFLAHVWRVFGIDTAGCDAGSWPQLDGCDGMIQAGQIANLVLGTINIGLVFALGWLIKGPRTALLSAAIYTIIPSRFIYTSALMSEEAFVTLVLAALIMLVLGVRRQDWVLPTALGFGLAIGAAAFVRPLGVVLLPLPLVLLFSKAISPRIAFTQLGIGAVVVLAMLLPWEVRNNNEVGGWNFVSNNGGINLWIGCHLDDDGGLASKGKWMDWWSGDAPAEINTADERANDSEAQQLGLECMREQPLAFARLSLLKGLYTFREDWVYVSKWALNDKLPDRPVDTIVSGGTVEALGYLSNSVYLVLLPLSAVGALAFFFGPSVFRGMVGAAFAALALIPLAFFGDPRFHVPLFPMMSIWAAEGVWIVLHGLRSVGKEAAEESPRRVVPYEWREEPWLR